MDADDVSLRDRIEVLVNYLLLHPEIDCGVQWILLY
jgi:hypothetical protein